MSEPQRRRPGRVRRWLVRPVVWILLLPLVLAAVTVLYLGSRSASERVRLLAETRIAEALERPVSIGGARLDLFPPRLELREIEVAGATPEEPALVRAEAAGVELSLERLLLRRSIRLERVWLDRPVVELALDSEGRLNIPRPKGRGGGGEVVLEVAALVVDQGVVRFQDLSLPLDVRVEALRGAFSGASEGLRLAGRVDARSLEVKLPDAEPWAGALTLQLDFDPERQLEIVSGRVTGPDATADLQGVVTWAESDPEVHLTVEARVQAELATRLGYLDGEVRGPVRFNGRFDWEKGSWTLRGQSRSPALTAYDLALQELVADLEVDPEQLVVELARADHAGGTLSGNATVELRGERRVTARLNGEALSLRRLVEERGLERSPVRGRADVRLLYTCLVSAPLEGEGQIDVSASLRPTGSAPAFPPLSGSGSLLWRDGLLSADRLRFTAPGHALSVSRFQLDMGTRVADFDYRLVTEQLGPWTAMLEPPAVDGADSQEGGSPSLLPVAGQGRIEGRARVSPDGYGTELRLALTDPVLLDPLARPWPLDRLEGNLSIQPDGIDPLRLQASLGAGALLVAGKVDLGGGEEPVALDLTVDAQAWPAETLPPWLATAIDLSGPISGALTLGGSVEQPRVEGRLGASRLVIDGRTLGEVEADFQFAGDQLRLSRFEVADEAGRLTGSAEVDLGPTGLLRIEAETEDLDLALEPLSSWIESDVTGLLSAQVAVEGTRDQPLATLEARIGALVLGGRELGEVTLEGRWEEGQLSARGEVAELVTLEGGGPFDGREGELRFAVETDHLKRVAAWTLGDAAEKFSGSAQGELRLAGSLSEPLVELTLDPLSLRYDKHRLRSLEPVVARLDDTSVVLESLYLGYEQEPAELFLRGSVGLVDQELDLVFQGALPAAWAEPALPQARLRGFVSALGHVGGTVARPELDGQADLTEGQLILSGFPHALEELTAVALVYPDRIKLDEVKARVAGGRLQAAGTFEMDGLSVTDYRLQAEARRVRLRYPEGWLMAGDALVTVEPDEDGRLLQGTIDLTRAEYLRDVSVGTFQLLQGALSRRRLEVATADTALASTHLNLLVRTPDGLRVANNVADLSGGIDLILRGNLARPIVLGNVELEPGGELVYDETRYEVEQGLMTFASSTRIDPQIDLVARTEIKDYAITLNLSGPLSRLQANLASDPPLPDLQVLSLLTTGGTFDGQFGSPTVGEGDAVARNILYGQAASAVSSRVKRLFGFDTFSIDPVEAAADTEGTARVTVGKQLARKWFVTYSNDPSSNRNNIVTVEWQALPGLVIEVSRIDSEDWSADVRWQKKF